MTHPGEQFYPQGVRWDDPIARGTLPDLLSRAAADYGARPAIEFRDRPISYGELEDKVETAASAFLRAGYGKDKSVALFKEQHHDAYAALDRRYTFPLFPGWQILFLPYLKWK